MNLAEKPHMRIHFSYQRYLENQIREVFGLMGTPVRITIRQKGDKEE